LRQFVPPSPGYRFTDAGVVKRLHMGWPRRSDLVIARHAVPNLNRSSQYSIVGERQDCSTLIHDVTPQWAASIRFRRAA
jgi:uncharacterized protein YaiL (DUF2058 family)